MPSLTASAAAGRPFFPPLPRVQIERIACTEPSAYGLHVARWDGRSLQPGIVEQAVVGAMHDTTVARIVAAASLQPHRRRYGKTATIDERFTTKAARILGRYERGVWLYERGEVVLCGDETPHLQAVARRVPTPPMRPGQSERREFEDTRHGTVTCLAALNVYAGTRWGCGVDANDHEHCLTALSRLVRGSPRARRRHLSLDHGASPIAQAPTAYVAGHPRLRAFYTPPHASWLNHAEWLRRALADQYLQRFDAQSRQHLIDHLEASGPEDNRRFAPPFTWSWSCRDLYAWARQKGMAICTNTYATVH
jgi:DDE superfamily endonuclease